MSALPSPSGSTSGPQRLDAAAGSSRHSHRVAAEPETAEHGGPGDGSWFTVVLRGYDRSQVDTRLADLDDRIHEEIRRADAAEHALSDARAQVRRLQEQVAAGNAGNPAGSERRADDAGFGRRVERVLQAAEQEADELRERAATEAEKIVSRAREEAEDRRTRTEEALLGRAATLDREFTSRSATLEERDDDLTRREGEVAERERTVDERLSSVREEADRILTSARGDADDVLTAARDEAVSAVRDAERDSAERRAGVARDIERLAALRDEVRGELTRVRETLTAELDREPVTAALDDALFGPSGRPVPDDDTSVTPLSSLSSLDSPRGTSFVWSSGTGADLTASSVSSADDTSDTSDEDGKDESEGDPDRSAPLEAGDDQEAVTGTLLLGPGRRAAAERDDDPDRTTIGQIPPISLTSIGVLPFGDLGAGRDNARTRTDGADGASRAHRGPTRGPAPGRRSR